MKMRDTPEKDDKEAAGVAQLTKTAIMDAFTRLLEQMPMDQITVQAVTAGCGISRNTFYYHYGDIYALLKAVLQRDMDMLLAQRRPGEHGSEGLRRLIEYISTRQRMMQHIYSAVGHATMEDYLLETTGELFMAYLRDAAEGLNPSEEDLDFICRSFQFMLIGILLSWVRHGMKGDVADLLERAERLFFHGTRRLLEENSQ